MLYDNKDDKYVFPRINANNSNNPLFVIANKHASNRIKFLHDE